MDFRLLGPLDVRDDGRALGLGGPKQRALLAVLLLHANRVVPTEQLIDELWTEEPPATVTKSVQVYVSRLRRELGEGRLVTRPPGYLLRVGGDEIDLVRFERLVEAAERGTPDVAARRLREALGLWRGPPLADLAHEPFARAEIARLTELRLAALEDRIEADLTLGRHGDLVGELDALVREHPLRERLRSRLMLCLYRCGRQADALEAFRTGRAQLVEELGIEPGRQLRELHEAILRQDPALDPRSAQPTGTDTFVGRDAELRRLATALDGALAGHGHLVLLSGEPGIGKSRLAEELSRIATARRARVLVGRCWEAGGAPAYWPWVQSLRTYLRELDDATLRERLGAGGGALAGLLPDLRRRLPDLPEAPAPELEGARFRLFDAVTDVLHRAAAVEPVVIVLDDLHAADEPSLLLLRYVAREIAGSRVLVIGTFRDVDPAPRAPLLAALAALLREPGAEEIRLRGLGPEAAAGYLAIATGRDPAPAAATEIHERTEGNPFFMVELVRLVSDGGDIRIPPGVRAVIAERVGRLPDGCRAALDAASVLGREFSPPVLARICELAEAMLLERLEPALVEQVIDEAPGGAGRLRFSHALVRDTLYEGLTTTRRRMLHARAGGALEALRIDRPAEVARHFLAAGMPEDAVRWTRLAADRAMALLAHEEAIRLYEQALGLATDPAERCELLLAIGDARARTGDRRASKTAFRDAADLATAHTLQDHLGRAALGYGGRIIWDVSRDDPILAELLERALATLPETDSALRVRLLARLAGGPLRDARAPAGRRRRLSADALDAARRIGDDATLAYAIHGYILGHHSPSHTQRQLELASELIAVAARAGDEERVVEGLEEHLDAALELGDAGTADADLLRMAAVAERLRQPSQRWLVAVYRAMLALLRGEDDAGPLVEGARRLGEGAQSWNATVTYRLQLYALRREQGRLGDVVDLLHSSVLEFPTYPVFRTVLAQVAAEMGDEPQARAMLATALPDDEEWLVGTVLLGEAAALLGDTARAAQLHRALSPFAARIAVSAPEISTGAVARVLGMLAAALGRRGEAAHHFAAAIDLQERIGARPWVERTRRDHEAWL